MHKINRHALRTPCLCLFSRFLPSVLFNSTSETITGQNVRVLLFFLVSVRNVFVFDKYLGSHVRFEARRNAYDFNQYYFVLKSSTKHGNIKFHTTVFSGNGIVSCSKQTDMAIVIGAFSPLPRTPNMSLQNFYRNWLRSVCCVTCY